MALRTRCIFEPREEGDGIRISVMSRHTLNDGVTTDRRIDLRAIDMHWPMLGPSPRLIGDYLKRGLLWATFAARYRAEMREREAQAMIHRLAALAALEDVTLLCVESDPACCHRSLLAQLCQRSQPRLIVVHR